MAARVRAWCLTVNNPSPLDEETFESVSCRYAVYGKEVGQSGTPHLQGYVYFSEKKSMKQLKSLWPRAHVEPAKGTPQQNRDYCIKDGDYLEFGEIPMDQKSKGICEKRRWSEALQACKEGRLDDVPDDIRFRYYRTCNLIKKDYMQPPEDAKDVTGVWIYGAAGVGKSRRAREEYPKAFMKPANKWWDGYQGEEYVIIDDLDKKHNVLGHHLKIWGDRYFFIAEIKGGAVACRPSKIVVTSQYAIEEIWEDQESRDALNRRFEVIYME